MLTALAAAVSFSASCGGNGFTDIGDASVDARAAGGDSGGSGEDGSGCDPACTGDLVCCAGNCVDTSNSATNCGGCGIACGPGSHCSPGRPNPLNGGPSPSCQSTLSSGGGSGGSSSSGSSSGGSSGSGASGSGSSGSGSSGSSGGRDAGSLACGPYTCKVATEFCYEAGGGAVLPEGGSNFTYACNPIPAQCEPDPTCACIVAADAGTHGCPCSVQPGGALLAACLYP